MTARIETMMYHGKRPWHALGTPLDHPATAQEAIVASGLAWGVALEPVFDRRGTPVPRSRAIVRTDRMEPISVVGERYAPLQNLQAFAFMDHLVGEGRAVYETAGALAGGRRIWLLARLPGDLWVTKEDAVGKYLLLTNSHDGGSPVRALFTPIRVVCENTLRAALGEGASEGVSIRHVGDVLGKAQEARRLLGISFKYFDDFASQAKAFAGRSLTQEALAGYFETLVPDPQDGDPSRAIATRESLVRLFETGRGNALPSVRGTLWGAVNAVAEFVDHERPTRHRAGESEPVKRFQSAQFGSGSALRARAWTLALGLLG